MKVAIMQPYFLPYIGYWQLMAAVDKFIVLDDVAFIPRGWINRNRILVNGSPYTFTLPVSRSSQNRRICEIERTNIDHWLHKFRITLRQSYGRSPHYKSTMAILDPILDCQEPNLARFTLASLKAMANDLGIATEIDTASNRHPKQGLGGQDRIIDICRQEGATCYINPPGGVAIYDMDKFAEAGIALKFISPNGTNYPQATDRFVPWLSIVDILMNIGLANTRSMVNELLLA